jgi:hypothetical protein
VNVADTPLILPTVVVLLVAALEWRATRPVAWVALAAGFVLLVGSLRYPALSATEINDFAAGGLALAIVVAKIAGAGCFLWTVTRTIRSSAVPW